VRGRGVQDQDGSRPWSCVPHRWAIKAPRIARPRPRHRSEGHAPIMASDWVPGGAPRAAARPRAAS